MTWGRVERDALLDRTGDPFVRYAVPSDALALTSRWGWACLGRWRRHGHWGGLAVVGPGSPPDVESAALRTLTGMAAEQEVRPEWFSTVGEGRVLSAPPGLRVESSGTWAFLWTAAVTGLPATPAALVELDDTADAEEIETFGRRHNADFEGFPGHGFAALWLGVRDGLGLAAVGGLHVLGSGAPHLAGIVVRPDRRGTGLGLGLTAELTRRAVARHGVSTLGVDADNVVALSLYRRAGYATAHHLHTRSLVPAPTGGAGT